MSIKKSQIEDKSIRPTKPDTLSEFNYPDHNITIKASNKEEADNKLKDLIKTI